MPLINAAVVSAACVALGSLATWGTWRDGRALGAYLAAVIIGGMLPLSIQAASTPAAFVAVESALAGARFFVGFDLARRMAAELPGVRTRIHGAVIVALALSAASVAWGRAERHGAYSVYRSLALTSAGAGLLLLGLRALAVRYQLTLPVVWRATSPLGLYLVAHSLLLGADTEAAASPLPAAVSSGLWCAWALWLALSAWASRHP